MRISIIIPTYNRNADLRECLESLKVNSRISHEVIVLAPSVTGEIETICNEYKAKLVFDESRVDGNRVKSLWGILNFGISLASQDWVVWLNDDCLVTEGWDEKVFSNLDPKAALIVLKTFGIAEVKEFRIGRTKFGLPCANYAFLKKSLGIRFDEGFNWFHGDADISLQIASKNLIIHETKDDIVIHNHKQDLNRQQNENDERSKMDDILLEKKWRYWVRKRDRLRKANLFEAVLILVSILGNQFKRYLWLAKKATRRSLRKVN